MRRRSFLASTAALAVSPAPVRFGVDLFSIRSSGYSPFEYLDYCARLKARVVHFSEIRFIGNLEEAHLRGVRAHAEKLGIELELGMRSVCPTSRAFDASQGSAEEQILRAARAARTVGSPIVRAFLGTMADRAAPLHIEGNIESTVHVLRAVRSRVMDLGVKIAIENHAGDMQARELKMLIDEAGKDFVGACIDSGNPVWALEDPHLTLETLAPYVITSHVRDSAVWIEDGKLAVRWTRMGEGNVGIDQWVRRFAHLCPGKPLSMEIIVTPPRYFAYQDEAFWEPYRNVRAGEFIRFLKIAEAGRPLPGRGPAAKEEAAQRERDDLEASTHYTQRLIGL